MLTEKRRSSGGRTLAWRKWHVWSQKCINQVHWSTPAALALRMWRWNNQNFKVIPSCTNSLRVTWDRWHSTLNNNTLKNRNRILNWAGHYHLNLSLFTFLYFLPVFLFLFIFCHPGPVPLPTATVPFLSQKRESYSAVSIMLGSL